MKNEDLIKKIAEPILEQLKKQESRYKDHSIMALPEIHFIVDKRQDGPIKLGDVELTDEIIRDLEAYLQEQIEATHKPTILH